MYIYIYIYIYVCVCVFVCVCVCVLVHVRAVVRIVPASPELPILHCKHVFTSFVYHDALTPALGRFGQTLIRPKERISKPAVCNPLDLFFASLRCRTIHSECLSRGTSGHGAKLGDFRLETNQSFCDCFSGNQLYDECDDVDDDGSCVDGRVTHQHERLAGHL